jgi:hypothetical protein
MEESKELLQYFSYEHLPAFLQEMSKKFAELAEKVAQDTKDNSERYMALRKLLEAKDCAVRSLVAK